MSHWRPVFVDGSVNQVQRDEAVPWTGFRPARCQVCMHPASIFISCYTIWLIFFGFDRPKYYSYEYMFRAVPRQSARLRRGVLSKHEMHTIDVQSDVIFLAFLRFVLMRTSRKITARHRSPRSMDLNRPCLTAGPANRPLFFSGRFFPSFDRSDRDSD